MSAFSTANRRTAFLRESYCWLLLLFLLSAGMIWVRTVTVRDTYRYVQQEKELKRLQQELQAARVTWLKLTAPKKLDALAARLNLAPPRLSQVLRYEPDKATLHTAASLSNGSPRGFP